VSFTFAFVPPVIVFLADVLSNGVTASAVRESTTWFAVLGLIASATMNIKRLAEDGSATSFGPPRRSQLEAANDLLTSLHQIAQRLPASLDIGEVLDSTAGRIRSIVPVDTLAILLDDGLPNQLSVAFSSGTALGDQIDRSRLPAIAMAAVEAGRSTIDSDLHNGLSGRSRSAIYLPLAARSSQLGLIAIEHKEPGIYKESELQLLADIAMNAGLEVDNARWFARIRTVGADEERNRIARDLHDRIGQALAYLGFELDRLNAKSVSDQELRTGVTRLRVDVRSVVQEVRDTLYDLRTEVSDQERLQPVLAKFCSRVAERSGLTITLATDPELNVGVRQERELWRIAQEAITNVERHARADSVEVTWSRDGDLAILTITDDGQGRNRGTHIRCSLAIDDPRRDTHQTTSGGKGQ
jgi:signal transduction histidine kinase